MPEKPHNEHFRRRLGLSTSHLRILLSKHARDFHHLFFRNPVACPLLGYNSTPGSPHLIEPPSCIQSPDSEIRTDFPEYRVYRHGKHLATRNDLLDIWRDDYVGFLIRCSFSFEDALTSEGLQSRH